MTALWTSELLPALCAPRPPAPSALAPLGTLHAALASCLGLNWEKSKAGLHAGLHAGHPCSSSMGWPGATCPATGLQSRRLRELQPHAGQRSASGVGLASNSDLLGKGGSIGFA